MKFCELLEIEDDEYHHFVMTCPLYINLNVNSMCATCGINSLSIMILFK